MDFDRALPDLIGPATPDYSRDTGLVPVESYQHDPTQPSTPLSPQHATLVTRELRNLVVGLGLVPDHETDNQLATALKADEFTPTLEDIALADVASSHGYYQRVGTIVHAWVFVAWVNRDSGIQNNEISIVPPFSFAGVYPQDHGVANNRFSALGPQADNRLLEPVAELNRLKIDGTSLATHGSLRMRLGLNTIYQVAFHISYRHNGIFNY